MKRKGLVTGLGLIACCSILFSVSASLMWFDNRTRIAPNQIVGSSNGAYYASGDGSKDDPFVINQPRHLYNLAWLQYLGTYNQEEDGTVKEVYFRVEGNTTNEGGDSILDMDGWTLPPIGTEENPFVGNFNGNDTIIKNLTVSNTFSDYGDAHPYYNADGNEMTEDNFVQPKIIGFFGVVGALDIKTYEYTTNIAIEGASYTEANLVYDTYVDNITIQNKTSNQELLAGLLAGYVNAPIKQCGVGYGEFSFASGTKNLSTTNTPSGATIKGVSNYSLIGAYNPDKFTYSGLPTTSGGDSQGEDYGTSIDIYSLYNKLSVVLNTSSNPLTIPNNYAIPIKFDSNAQISSGSGTTTVTSSGTSITANKASTIGVDSNATNIGYYSGALNVSKEGYSSKDFSNITTATNSPISYSSLTDKEKEKIQNYLAKATSTGKNSDNAIILNGTSNFNGMNQTKAKAFPISSSAYTVVENAKIGSKTTNAFIPTNGLWVAPTKPGRFEFIASGTGIQTCVLIIRLIRSEKENYSVGFKNTSYLVQFNNDWSGGMVGFAIAQKKVVYYGLEITQDDIDAGYEYFITNDADVTGSIFGYPTIFYLDIGTDGGDSGGDATKTSPTEIDFVYYGSDKKLVKITSDGTYVNSEVVFQIDSDASGSIAFKRNYTDGTSIVYYYIPTASSINITAIGTNGKSSQSDSELAEN